MSASSESSQTLNDEVYVAFKCRLFPTQKRLVDFFVARGVDENVIKKTLRHVRTCCDYPSIFPKTVFYLHIQKRLHEEIEWFALHNSFSFRTAVVSATAAALKPQESHPEFVVQRPAVVYSTIPRDDLETQGYTRAQAPLYRGPVFAYVLSELSECSRT